MPKGKLLAAAIFFPLLGRAQGHDMSHVQSSGDGATMEHQHHPTGSADCSSMEVWNYSSGMCMPLAMEGMPMRMLMLHANIFGVQSFEQSPRGRNQFAAPNMIMADLGTSLGARNYLNLEFMGTAERWTFPERGYPLLLQIGEHDENEEPFLDAQHPHSSPVMGLTLSDTITLGGEKNYLRVFFAPRGQSTEGPIAFMHRPTSLYNPDAPLGHHIGQDVGHITSTVLGATFKWNSTIAEASTFHGAEPEPTHVDLPLGKPNSVAVRLIQEFSSTAQAMVSAAHVVNPEPNDASIKYVNRYSASVYTQHACGDSWTFSNALIYGLVNNYDHAAALSSIGEEWLVKGEAPRIWGRFEFVQRTPNELEVTGLSDPNRGRWVTALTVGYGHKLLSFGPAELSAGASVTKDFLPQDFRGAYDGNPLSARVFLQLGAMQMWNL